jgi:predicted membrane-bound spermidine synthase
MKSTFGFAAVVLTVLLANASLMAMQLLASRWLVPWIGSSLETWTAIIGMFLLGIAAGNAVGGRWAQSIRTTRPLAALLAASAVVVLSMMGLPWLLDQTGVAAAIPLWSRVIVLAFFECFPSAFLLASITPVAIHILQPNRDQTGRTVGTIFAAGTVGCLASNYMTGLVLIPWLPIDEITIIVAAGLGLLAIGSLLLTRPLILPTIDSLTRMDERDHHAPRLSMLAAIAIVFGASFCGMLLELTASRILAQIVGVSLASWTGIIGVMLAGTAVGNWLGGRIAGHANASMRLTISLLTAAFALWCVLPIYYGLTVWPAFDALALLPKIFVGTMVLFFVPMLLLGTISPQVIALCSTGRHDAARTAGRIYAWSTAGAIAGTFATGFVMISEIGMYRSVAVTVVIVSALTVMVPGAWLHNRVTMSVASLGGLALAAILAAQPATTGITAESNYFTIRVVPSRLHPGALILFQDRLVHSVVKPDDPTFLFYFHEHIQRGVVGERRERLKRPQQILVIGGGGYTFPRAVRTEYPDCPVDVVEIDPVVTAISYSHLGLDRRMGIRSFHQDGRQFVREAKPEQPYDIITLDAVNDLSVPEHLLTDEFNAAVKQILAADGIYLVTVIDEPRSGRLWKSAYMTLRKRFRSVEILRRDAAWSDSTSDVMLFYASDAPLNLERLQSQRSTSGGANPSIGRVGLDVVEELLREGEPGLVLTDRHAPVDYLMVRAHRMRK